MRKKIACTPGIALAVLLSACSPAESPPILEEPTLTPAEAREIAKEAYIYGNPMVDSYRILHTFFVDSSSPQYKGPWNTIHNEARVFTHEDTTVQTANSDTPYSFAGIDLRAEPVVLSVPPMEASRYFSIQLIDLYTHIIGYIGSRTTGNDGGHFLLTGPGWQGPVPEDIDQVIPVETELMLAIYRTQLFNPEDLDNVIRIQSGYGLRTLSEFTGSAPPAPAPAIDFISPLSAEEIRTSPDVFEQLNFILQFCPTHESETELMQRFGRIGVGAGADFAAGDHETDQHKLLAQGIADAWLVFADLRARGERGELTSGDVFGSREHLQNNYGFRFAGAVLGIWGNSEEEAMYPTYYTDADGLPLSGEHAYTLRFAPGELPPVNSFWSLTMYGLPESLLVENRLNRYLLNSTMMQQFVTDDDGGITLYFQHDSPGKDLETNWLPAPEGPFSLNMRLYWPEPEALNGTWQQPPLVNTR